MVARVDVLIPDGVVAARELVLQVATPSIGHAAVEVLAVLGVPLESLLVAQSSGVLQILGRRLSRWLWFSWSIISCGCWHLLSHLLSHGLIVLDFIGQFTAFWSISVPGVDTGRADSVVDCSTDALESEGGWLGASLVYAAVENAAVAVVSVVAVAGAFVGSRHATFKGCGWEGRENERRFNYKDTQRMTNCSSHAEMRRNA